MVVKFTLTGDWGHQIMDAVISNIATHDVVFARLQQLSYALECASHHEAWK